MPHRAAGKPLPDLKPHALAGRRRRLPRMTILPIVSLRPGGPPAYT